MPFLRVRIALSAALFLAGTATAMKITPKSGSALLLRNAREFQWKAPNHLPVGAEYHLMRENAVTHGIQAIARFPAGYTIPEHTHKTAETIAVLKGKLWIRAAGKERTLRPGDYAVIPHGVPHTMKAAGWFRKTWTLTTTDGPYDLVYSKNK